MVLHTFLLGKILIFIIGQSCFVENSSNTIKGFKFALNFIFDNLRNCHKDYLSAIKNYDLIIGHGIVGEAEAEILGKPFITVSIAPIGLPKEYWKSKNLLWFQFRFGPLPPDGAKHCHPSVVSI